MRVSRVVATVVVLAIESVWTVVVFSFLAFLGTPSIEDAAAEADGFRAGMLVVWLSGLAGGIVLLVGMWRGSFHAVARGLRVRLAVVAWLLAVGIVAAAYWFRASGFLIFGIVPLVAVVLLTTGWAVTPALRKRLAVGFGMWVGGVVLVALAWYVSPPGSLGLKLWWAWGAITVVALAWWALPLLSGRSNKRT